MDIKDIRTNLGMTQQQFAVAVGVSIVAVSRWERGLSKPHPVILEKIEKLSKRGPK